MFHPVYGCANGLEDIRHPVQVFRMAHNEMPAWFEVTNQAAQNAVLHGLLEVDHDITAKNSIERAGDGPGGIDEV